VRLSRSGVARPKIIDFDCSGFCGTNRPAGRESSSHSSETDCLPVPLPVWISLADDRPASLLHQFLRRLDVFDIDDVVPPFH
jgi:hypothetical protein